MNKQEYEEKRYECWLDTANFCGFSARDDIKHSTFDAAFDRAYELGKQFGNSEQLSAEGTVISGWVARDKDGELALFRGNDKPFKTRDLCYWLSVLGRIGSVNPGNQFSDITWDSAPIEVELIIKGKKK